MAADEPIEVRIRVDDIPKGRTLNYGIWETYIYTRLTEAGIPVSESGDVLRGTLTRMDDPADFGVTVYRWKP